MQMLRNCNLYHSLSLFTCLLPCWEPSSTSGYFPLNGFLKHLLTHSSKSLVFCLHWARSLLESTAGFHTGFHRSAVLVQGQAEWKYQESKINIQNHSRSEICRIFSQFSMKASCPSQARETGSKPPSELHTAALQLIHLTACRSQRGLAWQHRYQERGGSYCQQIITYRWLKRLTMSPKAQVASTTPSRKQNSHSLGKLIAWTGIRRLKIC